MMNSTYHVPVLFEESIQALELEKDSIVVDVTFGGGGHSKEILNRLGKDGVLVAFDQDLDAQENLPDDERLVFVDANFRFMLNYLRFYDLVPVDSILADLGVSSHQFDTGDRGFSIREEGELDMRMNQDATLTAYKIVNEYPEVDLFRVFNSYADLDNVKKLVYTLVRERKVKSIHTTKALTDILVGIAPPKKQNQYLAQVFQALRIEVNDEMGALKEMLQHAAKALCEGGRLVVISYHSIEDRLVKNFMKTGNFEGKVEQDVFGRVQKPLEQETRKPIVPTEAEIERNPRARSAKMRIAVKL